MIETIGIVLAIVAVGIYVVVVAGARYPLLRQWPAWIGSAFVLTAFATGARLMIGRADLAGLIAFAINAGLAVLFLRQAWVRSLPYEERKRRGLGRRVS